MGVAGQTEVIFQPSYCLAARVPGNGIFNEHFFFCWRLWCGWKFIFLSSVGRAPINPHRAPLLSSQLGVYYTYYTVYKPIISPPVMLPSCRLKAISWAAFCSLSMEVERGKGEIGVLLLQSVQWVSDSVGFIHFKIHFYGTYNTTGIKVQRWID